MPTIRDYLKELGEKSSSSSEDDAKVQKLMRMAGFPNSVVVMGVVYLEGKGTIKHPPSSIHQVAKMLAGLK